jgi:hypothetical protein
MSDTEEVVITRTTRAPKNTKPEIAREKLKEKRERLKKEKENAIIEEAKKRIIEDEQKKKLEEEAKLKEEEDKKNTDPIYLLSKQMATMMAMLKPPTEPVVRQPEPEPPKKRAPRAKKVSAIEQEQMAKITVKPKPKPAPKPRAPRKKKVSEITESESNVFIGKERRTPPVQEVSFEPRQEQGNSNPLLGAFMSRRNMNSAY